MLSDLERGKLRYWILTRLFLFLTGKGKTAVLDLNKIIFIFDRSVEKFDKQQVTLFIYDVGEQSTKTFYLFLTKVPFIVLL